MKNEAEVVSALNKYLTEKNTVFANEIRMGSGIPDVMLGLGLNNKNIELKDFYLLKIYKLILDNKIREKEKLSSELNLPKKKINEIITKLKSCGVLSITEGKLKLLKKLDFINQGINISIEVKLKDWNKGLLQAQRYLSFSDYSYLAIQSNYLKNIDFEKAKKFGIGLISIDDNKINQELEPQKSKNCDYLFKYLSLSQLKSKAVISDNCGDSFFNINTNVDN